jgi:hypothetical protein
MMVTTKIDWRAAQFAARPFIVFNADGMPSTFNYSR